MNSYNPPYYVDYFIKYGFLKERDLYAFYLDGVDFPGERYERVTAYAMRKFKFRVDRVNLKQLDREVSDIRKVLLKTVPERWVTFRMPSIDDIIKEAKKLMSIIDTDFIYIARREQDDEPIGFVVAAPDYNRVLHKLKGRLFPFGFIKFLYYKKRIDAVRIFMQFVVPEYEGKAVNGTIFYSIFKAAKQKGMTSGEGSTIGEDNLRSIASVEDIGGELYRIYRMYTMDIKEESICIN